MSQSCCRLEAALKEYMQDFAQRMKQIKEALDAAEKQVGTH